jgi:hypothetical protein
MKPLFFSKILWRWKMNRLIKNADMVIIGDNYTIAFPKGTLKITAGSVFEPGQCAVITLNPLACNLSDLYGEDSE